jgi:hypothetical protein
MSDVVGSKGIGSGTRGNDARLNAKAVAKGNVRLERHSGMNTPPSLA